MPVYAAKYRPRVPDGEPGEFGAPQCTGEPEQEEGGVASPGRCVPVRLVDHSADVTDTRRGDLAGLEFGLRLRGTADSFEDLANAVVSAAVGVKGSES